MQDKDEDILYMTFTEENISSDQFEVINGKKPPNYYDMRQNITTCLSKETVPLETYSEK